MERQGRGSLGNGVLAVGISHSLPLDFRFIRGTHPLSFVQPHVHTGQSLGGGASLVVRERSDRAGSSSFSGLLQPAVCGDEVLRVVESGHRPLATGSESSEDFFQGGDFLVCSSLGVERGLDGVYRLEGCVLASSDASRKPQVPQIRSVPGGVSVQSSLLWTLHGSASLHAGHGSGFGFSSLVRHSSLPRRLAAPSVLPGAGSPCSGHSSPSLSFSGDRCQLGEVSVSSYSMYGVSGGSPGLCIFQGFACPKESREASLNWLLIFILRRAASVILARALRSAVFNDSARSGRSSSDAVSAIGPSAFLGPLRPVGSCQLDSGDSSGSGVVADSISTRRDFSRSGVPSAQLVVRRLGRRLGGLVWGRKSLPAFGH